MIVVLKGFVLLLSRFAAQGKNPPLSTSSCFDSLVSHP